MVDVENSTIASPGNIEVADRSPPKAEKIYGVYTHARPDGRVFYVGKGTERRANHLGPSQRTIWHARAVKKYGRANIKIRFMPCASEAEALMEEIRLIAEYRAKGTKLINITDGGDGVSGLKHTDSAREKVRQANLGRKHGPLPASAKAKISAVHKGKKKSAAHIEKMRIAFSGRKASAETRAKMSASQMGKVLSEEAKTRLSILKKGKPLSAEHLRQLRESRARPEVRARMSAAQKGRTFSEATRAKMRAARLGKKYGPRPLDVRLKIGVSRKGQPGRPQATGTSAKIGAANIIRLEQRGNLWSLLIGYLLAMQPTLM
ncbi:MAG TPA: NUMOD3 domain-containing DNA-binding protein [Bryobacteraceae bacterium]|nr:NUMOD3 domain-containing DNA-binding protein [Bryobacteraceae bacterium]